MRPLALIVCYAEGRVIGLDGTMPWHYPEDLKRFKRLTLGHALVMGRRTHESIGRPLPGRRNLVVSRNPDYAATGCEVHASLEAALAVAYETDGCPFVIGGAAIYAAALPLATRLYVTEIQQAIAGDVFFPALDPAAWTEIEHETGADGTLVFRVLERAPAPR